MTSTGATIRITRRSGGFHIEQRRPDLARLVAQMPIARALELVPTLLPVCAEAQAIAAVRATEAACGAEETADQRRGRGARLLREQGLAAAWRLLVDWPRALGENPDLAHLKTLRGLENQDLANALDALLPPPLVVPEPRYSDIEACLMASGLDSPLPANRALARARSANGRHSATLATLDGSALWDRARSFLGGPLITRGALGLTADAHAITVGPLAMARHPSIAGFRDDDTLSATTRLLLAALLDIAVVAQALRSDGDLDIATERQRSLGSGIGIGQAVTIRGPLLHMVVLDEREQVQHWRHLAPTDWHFAPGGLVDRLAVESDEADLRLLIAAADPCAPWEIEAPEPSGQEAA